MTDLTHIFGIQFVLVSLRYLLFAGVAYAIVWGLLSKKLERRRIQKSGKAAPLNIRGELKYAISTTFVFTFTGVAIVCAAQHGYTRMYSDIHEHGGVLYVGLSLVISILIHDAYFYFTHRAMHHPKIFRMIHAVHHRSRNPSPWAAYSFHPLEALIQAAILPILVFTIPLHGVTIVLFLTYVMVLNVLGHLGYELFSKTWARSHLTNWHNTATHHTQHHQTFKYNFSLYFNWWDKWLGTNHPQYMEYYDEVLRR